MQKKKKKKKTHHIKHFAELGAQSCLLWDEQLDFLFKLNKVNLGLTIKRRAEEFVPPKNTMCSMTNMQLSKMFCSCSCLLTAVKIFTATRAANSFS